MPESLNDAFKLADIARNLVVGAIGSATATVAFFSRYQTKRGCKKSHATHDAIEKEKQKLRDEQRSNMHEAVIRIETLVNKIADDVYEPRTGLTRRRDK